MLGHKLKKRGLTVARYTAKVISARLRSTVHDKAHGSLNEYTGYVPRRAMLYVPASSSKMLGKAKEIEVDSLVLELEDGVANGAKEQAREQATSYLASLESAPPAGHQCFDLAVRLNSLGSGMLFHDLKALARSRIMPNTFVVPKVDSAEQPEVVMRLFRDAYGPERLHDSRSRLIIMIEDPRALLNMPQIIESTHALSQGPSPRFLPLHGAIFGSDDYCAKIGATRSNEGTELLYARQRFVTCCKAYGIQAIDAVFIAYRDFAGLKRQSEQGKAWGFDGKQCIHPAQVPVIQRAFLPSEEEFEWASSIVSQYEEQSEAGKGAFTFKGSTMIDRPLLLQARNIVRQKDLISKKGEKEGEG